MQAVIFARSLGEEGLVAVRKFCNSLPFTWLEAGTEGKDYLAMVDIPLSEFQNCVQHVEMQLSRVGGDYEISMLDPSKTKPLSLPEEMFEEKRGWRLYDEADRTMRQEGDPERQA